MASFWSRLVVALLVASVTFAPAVALACPQCAGRNDSGPGGIALLAAMALLPFAVAAVVIRIVRRSEQR